jgi:ribosomal protein S18 acetylase RimI-like enzyme
MHAPAIMMRAVLTEENIMPDAAPTIRDATRADLPAIVRMLADDPLGATRERATDPLPREYLDAFDAIRTHTGNHLLVADLDGKIVGCLQLTFIPGLSRMGLTRAQIESVRIDSSMRGRKLGELMIQDAIARARVHGCGVVQLTTDKARADAHRFYERLGFKATHEGMKLSLA